jgi:hypothetical protein
MPHMSWDRSAAPSTSVCMDLRYDSPIALIFTNLVAWIRLIQWIFLHYCIVIHHLPIILPTLHKNLPNNWWILFFRVSSDKDRLVTTFKAGNLRAQLAKDPEPYFVPRCTAAVAGYWRFVPNMFRITLTDYAHHLIRHFVLQDTILSLMTCVTGPEMHARNSAATGVIFFQRRPKLRSNQTLLWRSKRIDLHLICIRTELVFRAKKGLAGAD